MKPTIVDIIQRGYFPKELPPVFNTFNLGEKYKDINSLIKLMAERIEAVFPKSNDESDNCYKNRLKNEKKRYSSSRYLKYSITKGKLSRRYIGIPNPLHYIKLVEELINTWDEIMDIINASAFSQSKPVYQKELYKRSFTTSCRGVSDFRKECLNISFDKKIELKLDISRFYPSIYTHSIAWALLGKEKAKDFFNLSDESQKEKKESGNSDYIIYDKGNKIDRCIRNCQGMQTIGIPIGPDVSFIISELICSRIDDYIKKYNNIVGCRYYDDYYLYVDTLSDAENLLKHTQNILDDFGLSINEEKIQIREFPFEFEDQFAVDLSKFDLTNNTEHSLRIYFNLIWKYAANNPRKIGQIFRYGLKPFDPTSLSKIKIETKEWNIFEDLLFKTMVLDPSILNIACRIINSYSTRLTERSINKMAKIVHCIFTEHIPLKQDLEISWALWVCKVFDLYIDPAVCVKILKMRNSISSLILLDIINGKLILKNDDSIIDEIKELNKSFTDKSLFDEDWLLLYEGVLKGWIDRKDLINNNCFYKALYDLKISFYDENSSADYSSNNYILSKMKQPISSDLREKSQNIAEEIVEEIFSRKAQEILDNIAEETDYLFNEPKELEEIKTELKEQFNKDDLKNEVLDSILLTLLDGDNIDKEEIICQLLKELDDDYLSY